MFVNVAEEQSLNVLPPTDSVLEKSKVLINLLQPENALLPIEDIFVPPLIVVRLVHPENTPSFKTAKLLDNITEVNPVQPENTDYPKVVTSDKSIDVKLEQLRNTLLFIVVTFDISIVVNEEHPLKAPLPIDTMFDIPFNVVKFVQPKKHSCGISVALVSNVIDVKALQYAKHLDGVSVNAN